MTSQGNQPEEQQPATSTPGSKSPALVVSPARSRETSPIRQQFLSPPALQPRDARLRTYSDGLPSVLLPNPLLGGHNNSARPKNLPATDAGVKTSKSESSENGSVAMRWPTSPRLKSPPATTNPRRNSSNRQSEPENADGDATTQSSRTHPVPLDIGPKSPVMAPNTGASQKNPRGFSGLPSTLETVEEGDHSSSPNKDGVLSTFDGEETIRQAERDPADQKSSLNISPERSDMGSVHEVPDSDVDSLRLKDTSKETPKDVPKDTSKGASSAGGLQTPTTTKKINPQTAAPAKLRSTTEGSSKNMTVETETVASIPQSSAGTNNAERSGPVKKEEAGSVRANPNNETVKPRKEKKKSGSKRPGATSGQSTSKADIFEAKVMTSAAEDDDSESDETFVYESNPQETRIGRPPRNHSRTPSANSTRSLTDRKPGSRPLGNLADAQRGVRAKRSMKFASNSYAADDEGGDREQGTVRAHRNKNGSSSGHHHMHGFSKDNHQGQGEEDSPFSQASKLRNATNVGSTRSLKVPTPRSGSPPPYSQTPTKGDHATTYEFEHGRTFSEQDPLLGTTRAPRSRLSRNFNSQYEESYPGSRRRTRGYVRRFAGCTVVTVIVVSVLIVAFAFLFATTHPLYDVELVKIKNIIATEESLMADLECTATNPNIVPIIISDMDVNIFAKSLNKTTSTTSKSKSTTSTTTSASKFTSTTTSKSITKSTSKTNPKSISEQTSKSTYASALKATTKSATKSSLDPTSKPSHKSTVTSIITTTTSTSKPSSTSTAVSQTILLGRVFHFDSDLTFDASPLRHIPGDATGSLRLNRPGNDTEPDGSARWNDIMHGPFELIVRGILRYTLPFSSRVVTASVGTSVRVDPGE